MAALAREELRRIRHVPDGALSLRGARLETAVKRLQDMYLWQEMDEDEYRAERDKLKAQLAELPPPADSNVVAVDRMGERLLPIADIVRDATPDQQMRIARHVIESVVIGDGEVVDLLSRPEARPFYEAIGNGAPGRI